IGNTGQAYNNLRWAELAFFIAVMRAWKSRPVEDRERLVGAPWAFASWLDTIEGAERRQLRHMLLHLLFPETFERIASGRHKRLVVERFAPELDPGLRSPDGPGDTWVEIDRQLAGIRAMLEARYPDQTVDFYCSPVHELWQPLKDRNPVRDEKGEA